MTTLSTTPTLIIPAIDLKDGKCVRLKQGRMEDDTVFSDDPVAMASRWVKRRRSTPAFGGFKRCFRWRTCA